MEFCGATGEAIEPADQIYKNKTILEVRTECDADDGSCCGRRKLRKWRENLGSLLKSSWVTKIRSRDLLTQNATFALACSPNAQQN